MNILKNIIKVSIVLVTFLGLVACNKSEMNQITIYEDASISAIEKTIGEEEEQEPFVQINGRLIDSDSNAVINQHLDLLIHSDSSIVDSQISDAEGNFQTQAEVGDYLFRIEIEDNQIYTAMFHLTHSTEIVTIVLE